MPSSNLKTYALLSVTLVGITLLGYLSLHYLCGILFPFLIGWGLAFLTRPIAFGIHRGTRIPVRFLRLALVLVGLGLIFSGLWALASRFTKEAEELLSRITQEGLPSIDSITASLPPWLASVVRALPFWANGEENALLTRVMSAITDALTATLPSLVGSIVASLPPFLLSMVVALIAAIYFCLDLEKINAYLLALFPPAAQKKLLAVKESISHTALLYLRSYLILALVTFTVLLIGFMLIGVEYALLLAAFSSIVDVFPVLGVGTVLIPYSIGCFLFGNTKVGVGLIILYLVSMLLRQYLEPRIVGGSLGIHPVAALFFMYAGLKLGGVVGMLLAPILGILLVSLLPTSKEKSGTPRHPSHASTPPKPS